MSSESVNMDMDVLKIIENFYPEDTDLHRMLLKHSMQVRDKALDILDHQSGVREIDRELVSDGAMLHDVGIFRCHAPGILCTGESPYIAHGIIGAGLLREYGRTNGLDLERFARICERHTGAGLSAEDIRRQALPLPEKDFLPETVEEKLICLADKFYSKSGDMREKSFDAVRRSMMKFGGDTLKRFDEMCELFSVKQ